MSFLDPVYFFFLIFALLVFHLLMAGGGSNRVAIPLHALVFLFLASSLFYAFADPRYLLLLFGSSLWAFLIGEWIARLRLNVSSHATSKSIRMVLALGVIVLLTPLFIFKYFNFTFHLISSIFPSLSGSVVLDLVLPIGISFFTFQNICYVTDVYRGVFPAERNVASYLLYISFFPHLVAGPIMTAREFLPQLRKPIFFSNIPWRDGFYYLASGYIKKALLADRLATIVDPVYANPEQAGTVATIVAVLAYSLQIYFDFSGYTDIAIGTGKFFGFHIPENFNFPYSAIGIRDFWRRWHITLSSWLRDHIYIPLGGSHNGTSRTVIALFMTMLLGGLWHGAHLNFILWGGAHGLLLVAERQLPANFKKINFVQWMLRIYTFVSVTLLWIFFRAGSYADGWSRALNIFKNIFSYTSGDVANSSVKFLLFCYLLLIVTTYKDSFFRKVILSWSPEKLAVAASVCALIVVAFAPGSSSFIYFVF